MRLCLLEDREEDIFYVFAWLRMEIFTMRRKRLKAYKEFVRMVHSTLGYGVWVELPVCCVKEIREDFPKESDGQPEYTGLSSSTQN